MIIQSIELNNFRNYENKVPKSKKERVRNILNHYE